jgi:dTDP-4-dehydrorhamnose reductase
MTQTSNGLEIWAGVECTINRVADQFFDQCQKSGHDQRLSDLDALADLGIKKIRYPVLWEKHARLSTDTPDFSWAAPRLERLRQLNVTPIAGLVHHGSGPCDTSLLDPTFAERLAKYAGAVAERFPWLEYFTPVNEPLTTARFAGLYGHWYPHGKDDATFARCLLTELKATVLAVQAIRQIIPHAKLVQTEDLAKIFSTPPVAHQAEYENERRWVSFDLLLGNLTPASRLYQHFRHLGIPVADLDWFRKHPCPPDILGVNYYVTSERFLDHRVEAYPSHAHAGNGRDRYADVAACHVRGQGSAGLTRLLLELHNRFHLPAAVTEVHLGCTREEQLRWLAEIWSAADMARRAGVDVRALTAWCAFGAYNWNSLVTRDENYYEPGLFDLRAPAPRPTAVAHLVRRLAAGEEPDHPVLDSPGWWRRPHRFLFAATHSDASEPLEAFPAAYHSHRSERPLLITGAGGRLASAIAHACEARGLRAFALSRAMLDLTDRSAVEEAVRRHRPWAVINAAGSAYHAAVDRAVTAAGRVDAVAPAHLARACAAAGSKLLFFSSDQVFSPSTVPHTENSRPHPVTPFGHMQASAEREAFELLPSALLVRTGPLFGFWRQGDFLTAILRALADRRQVHVPGDILVSPSFVWDVVNAALDLLVDDEQGPWHLASPDPLACAAFARVAAEHAGLDPSLVRPLPTTALAQRAHRLRFSPLASVRHSLLPPVADSLARAFEDLRRNHSHDVPCQDRGDPGSSRVA